MTTSGLQDSFDSQARYQKLKSQKNKLKSHRFCIYNFYFFLTIFTPMLLVGVFNWLVDPYDVFNTPNFWGINQIKPKKDNNDRLFKATDIIRLKPKTILMGSSRTKQGLNPEHLAFKTKQPVYNLAINGPNFYEVRRYIEHAIASQPDLKEIVLGVDFFMFNDRLDNQPSFLEKRLEKKHLISSDLLNTLFSLDTVSVSQETIKANFKESELDKSYGENGFMPNRNANDGNTDWRFQQSINLYFTLHSDYQFSERYWSDFKALVELCHKNNIALKVFISPAHATNWEAIRLTGQWKNFEQWKRKLVKIMSVWDFSGYNSVTTEPIAQKMSNYVDNSHYTPTIGNLILNRIFDYQIERVPEDFGLLITTQNIEKHLAKIRSDRETWVKNNVDEVQLVKKIQQKLKQQKTLLK
jgi:hypothetical protein